MTDEVDYRPLSIFGSVLPSWVNDETDETFSHQLDTSLSLYKPIRYLFGFRNCLSLNELIDVNNKIIIRMRILINQANVLINSFNSLYIKAKLKCTHKYAFPYFTIKDMDEKYKDLINRIIVIFAKINDDLFLLIHENEFIIQYKNSYLSPHFRKICDYIYESYGHIYISEHIYYEGNHTLIRNIKNI